jgi:hypothetical protein
MPGLRDINYKDRLAALKLCSLEEMRIHSDLILTYRIVKNKVDLNFNDFFKYSTVTFTRGHDLKLSVPFSRLDSGKYSYSRRIPVIWNFLPANVVNAPSVAKFKVLLQDVDLSRFLRGRDLR